MKILVLNAGSSSQKSCLYQLPDSLPTQPPQPQWQADIDWTESSEYGKLTVKANSHKQQMRLSLEDKAKSTAQMLNTLVEGDTAVLKNLSEIDIVGHRVVHGGEYTQPTRITAQVKKAIADLIPLAPNHNPAHLEGIEAVESVLGNTAQLAVFDTAFHRQMPPQAAVYPIPYRWYEQGIRRYGFHGISHQYVAQQAAKTINQPLESLKIITCHLGNGCSLAAIKDGKSINTTMGFTPLEGLMMGTRSGSIDPAILIYLIQEHNFNAEQLNHMLNKESGLLGVSGISGDLRQIIKAVAEENQQALLALDMYIDRLKQGIGAMLASLGGLDVLVFTAGVGENAVQLRERVCEGFAFMGLKLDSSKNEASATDISAANSSVKVLVIPTNEDWAIAQACCQHLTDSTNL